MGCNVFFDGDDLEAIERGELIFLAVVAYVPAKDILKICITPDRPEHETAALLSKFLRSNAKWDDPALNGPKG